MIVPWMGLIFGNATSAVYLTDHINEGMDR